MGQPHHEVGGDTAGDLPACGAFLSSARQKRQDKRMPSSRPNDSRDHSADGRDESASERADRNWNEILQELRVLQTGTQILTGFLLALAFQPAFADLNAEQKVFYLTLVVLSALSTIVALAPVALHRILFQQRAKPQVVSYSHAALITALVIVSVLSVGVVGFIFDVVLDRSAAVIVVLALTVVVIALWAVGPAIIRARLSPVTDRG
jgi:preprotein translocase subunit Sss1